MSIGSQTLSDKRRTKELRVLQLHEQGYSYKKIASEVHLSLRDVSKFINLAMNKRKSPSVTSIHDEILLEYRVNLLRSEVRDLTIERDNLKNELAELRAEYRKTQCNLRIKQSELDVVRRNLIYEEFSKEILEDILTKDTSNTLRI